MTDPTTADLVKAWRARTGLSQSQFAARVGMPVRTLQNIERGASRTDDALLRAALLLLVRSQGLLVECSWPLRDGYHVSLISDVEDVLHLGGAAFGKSVPLSTR